MLDSTIKVVKKWVGDNNL